MTTNSLAALAERINATSTAHGFWPTDREDALAAFESIVQSTNGLPGASAHDAELVSRYIKAQEVRNMGEMLMLAVSELAEALEEHRDGKPIAEWRCKACGRGTGSIDIILLPVECDGTCAHHRQPGLMATFCDAGPAAVKPEGVLVEIMDCVIRCLDTARGVVLEAGATPELIDHVTEVKMSYNDSRPHKHGKAY